MHGTNDLEVWHRRHIEMMNEAQGSRQAKELRESKKRVQPMRLLVWEMRRYAGSLAKLLHATKHNALRRRKERTRT